MLRLATAIASILLFGTSLHAASPASGCTMSSEERKWIQGAFGAWELVRTRKLRLGDPYRPTIIFFDSRCRYEAAPGPRLRWMGAPHGGKVRFPDGGSMAPAVTSFTAVDEKTGQPFFVMALPSVWRAANIHPGHRSLDDLLTFVFLHEYMHARQAYIATPFLEDLARRMNMPENIGDDSIQARFKSDPAYVAAYERERDLLYAAATEPDPAKARSIAAEALQAMRARQARWFTGADAYWKGVDDLFLTMEGVGQWSGYAWLTDRRGRRLEPAVAREEARGSRKWWSQEEGLGLFLVIDRLLPGWPAKAFAERPTLGIDLLAEAVGEGPTRP